MFKKLLGVLLIGVIALIGLPAQAVELNYGYDVSYPQGPRVSTLPIPGPFTVVGVNGGKAFYPNSYLGSLLDWAGPAAELYLNTGNPGPVTRSWEKTPRLQSWPTGTTAVSDIGIRSCDPLNPDSLDCAYIYGYLAASDSYAKAQSAFTATGWGNLTARTWWLDVETVNSWRGLDNKGKYFIDQGLNQAASQMRNVEYIKGSVYYLKRVAQVQTVGIYSTSYQWGLITGGDVADFSDLPSWHAIGGGATAEARAKTLCLEQPGFTGGQKTRVQYIDSALNLDVNVPCTLVKADVAPAYLGAKSVRVKRSMTLKLSLKTVRGVPVAGKEVSVTFAGQTRKLITGATGSVSAKIKAPKYRGKYRVSLSFTGTDILNPAAATASVKVYR
jgi:hypothetical protein